MFIFSVFFFIPYHPYIHPLSLVSMHQNVVGSTSYIVSSESKRQQVNLTKKRRKGKEDSTSEMGEPEEVRQDPSYDTGRRSSKMRNQLGEMARLQTNIGVWTVGENSKMT